MDESQNSVAESGAVLSATKAAISKTVRPDYPWPAAGPRLRLRCAESRLQVSAARAPRLSQFATCATARLAGHAGLVSDRSADLLCRGCGSLRSACRRPEPRRLAIW